MPLVSTIIPCHNAAKWLADTVTAALAQTWRNHEIIVVDDGSTDGSLNVARQFEHHGVRIIAQPNLGASAARNTGLRAAKGEFIQFLDADDLISPNKIESQIIRLKTDAPGKIASSAWARFTSDPQEATFVPEPTWRDLSGLEFQLLHYEVGWMMQPACWLCPRAVLDAVGPWDERLSLNDDGEFFNRVMLTAAGIIFCADAQVYYRSSLRGSLSRRRDRKALESLYLSTELNCTRLLRINPNDARIRGAAANGWQRAALLCYPDALDLATSAERHCIELGGSRFSLPGTATFRRVARVLGWRLAKQLWRVLGRA